MAQLLSTTIKGIIGSVNYVIGRYGWHITKLGDAEFNTVTTRGDINAKNVNCERVIFIKPKTYATETQRFIQEQYTVEDEIAIIRRMLSGDESVKEQFDAWNSYAENSKLKAKNSTI